MLEEGLAAATPAPNVKLVFDLNTENVLKKVQKWLKYFEKAA